MVHLPLGREDLADLLRARLPAVRLAYLFGSRAAGIAGAHSDFDIAVRCDHPLDPTVRWAIQEDLARALGGDVDLVDLFRASTVLRAQVVVHGNLILALNETERASFEQVALSAYARLNEERRAILADIRARGTIHG